MRHSLAAEFSEIGDGEKINKIHQKNVTIHSYRHFIPAPFPPRNFQCTTFHFIFDEAEREREHTLKVAMITSTTQYLYIEIDIDTKRARKMPAIRIKFNPIAEFN